MKIIDARSGREDIKPGELIKYPDNPDGTPEWWQLLEVRDRFLWADAVIQGPQGRQTVPLAVRFMHPAFPFQRIGFFPVVKIPLENRERAIYASARALVDDQKADIAISIMYCRDAAPHGLMIGVWSPEPGTELLEVLLEQALAAVRVGNFRIAPRPS